MSTPAPLSLSEPVDGRRRVIIHVGQTKAGSTSIQNYLEGQRAALCDRGILFPAAMMAHRNPFDPARTAGHLPLLAALRRGRAQPFLDEIAGSDATVVISMENLFADQPDDAVALLGDLFRDWHVTVVAVLRGQADWLRSRHVENVMSGFVGSVQPFAALVEDCLQRGILDYGARLDRLAGLLGADRVLALPFEGAEPLLRRFLRVAGLPVTDAARADATHDNRREKAAALIEAKRRLNLLIPDLPLAARLEVEQGLRQAARDILGPDDAPHMPAVPAAVIARCRAWNEALGERIDAPLAVGSGHGGAPSADPGRVRALIAAGLDLARTVTGRDGLDGGPVLACPAALRDAMVRAMQVGGVWLHLDSPASGLLGMTMGAGRRLDMLMMPRGAGVVAMARRCDLSGMGGVVLDLDAGWRDDPAAGPVAVPRPVAGIVADGRVTGPRIAALLETHRPGVMLVPLGPHLVPLDDWLPGDYRASIQGGLLTLSFSAAARQDGDDFATADEGPTGCP